MTAAEAEYLGKEYSEKILADVVGGFEEAKSLCYVGCLQRIANEVFDFGLSESKYRASFTIDTYGDNKARLKVKLEQIEPREEYDMLLEQLKIAIKDRLISDWNRCIWMTDDQSEALCTMLYPIVFETENEMRALVNKVLIHHSGVDWITLQNCTAPFWVKIKGKMSLGLSALGALFFMISLEPYAAMFTFLFLVIKALMLIKWE